MSMRSQRRVLIVDDNPGDVKLLQEALRETGTAFDISVAQDGVEALAILYGRRSSGATEHADMIFLDLNLPKKSGLDLLAQIKEDPELKWIPVIVFSASSAPADIAIAYQLHANCYVRKPASLEELFQVVAQIERFWYGTAILPNHLSELPARQRLSRKPCDD